MMIFVVSCSKSRNMNKLNKNALWRQFVILKVKDFRFVNITSA